MAKGVLLPVGDGKGGYIVPPAVAAVLVGHVLRHGGQTPMPGPAVKPGNRAGRRQPPPKPRFPVRHG